MQEEISRSKDEVIRYIFYSTYLALIFSGLINGCDDLYNHN